MILAPLTRGGNTPFRRLCADFGCEVAMGEMVFAKYLIKGNKIEKTRLRRAANEPFFGVQIATNDIEEGVRAATLAADAGANFVDLNCGCPIYEATRRNLGSALLRYPDKLARLVAGIAAACPVPLSVKIRVAAEGSDINVREVVAKLREAGAAAVTIHGRTAEARYSRAADWDLIAQCVDDNNAIGGGSMPIIGNGDILTHYEARQRMASSGVDGVMVGRGALTKPWIFDEFKHGEAWEPSAAERVEVYYRLSRYMKEHFQDDERGKRSAFYFLPWHFDFLTRYKPLPEEHYGLASIEAPLMQTRFAPLPSDAPPIERILSHPDHRVHELMANELWEAESDADAVSRFGRLAESDELAAIEREASGGEHSAEVSELANIPDSERKTGSGAGGEGAKSKKRRKQRPRPPQRTEAEIAALRAVRAAKRLATGAPPHVEGSGRAEKDTRLGALKELSR